MMKRLPLPVLVVLALGVASLAGCAFRQKGHATAYDYSDYESYDQRLYDQRSDAIEPTIVAGDLQ